MIILSNQLKFHYYMYTDFTNPVTVAVVTIVYLTFKLIKYHIYEFFILSIWFEVFLVFTLIRLFLLL